MAVDNSIPAHTCAANNNNNNSGDTSSPASRLTHEYLYRHNQRQQHHRPTSPLQPICTALPRYNNQQQQQQRNQHDDTPTTATIDNNSNVLRGIDLSEPGTARTLFSPNGDCDLGFHYNKHTLPSHNPFDDPSTRIENNNNDQLDPSLPSTSQPQADQKLSEQQQQPQQAWTNGRHPIAYRKYLALYTRFFRLDTIPATHSSQIVHSTWISTGALFSIRMFLFLYATCVLTADIIQTDRIRYEFCYLTQLSYLGLISYLGTVSWHTFSEWRRERGLRAIKASSSCQDKEAGASASEAAVAEMLVTQPTTIERQHWFLTDMIFFLYHTVCTFHVIVPILYWGYLSVNGEAHMMAVDISIEPRWRNYSFHGGDLILVLFEVSINAMPFIPSHILVVLGVCLLYLGEAHLVYRVDGFWLYPFLDTSVGPVWAAMYLGVGFAIACAFVIMYFLHRLRNWVITRRAASKVFRDAASSSSSSSTSTSAEAPEMIVVSSSVPVISRILYSNNNSNTLPTGTVLVSTDYNLTNSSNHNHHHHPIFTHTNTSTALFPTTAPPTTILATSSSTPASFQPSPQPHSIPLQAQILNQTRRRSYSNCSNDSTTSTLVGSDEGMMKAYKKEKESGGEEEISERIARRLSMSVPPQLQQADSNALERVEEEEDHGH